MKMFKKFFVVCLAIVSCLVSGCTFPLPNEKGHPLPNYRIIFVNETGMSLKILENNIIVQDVLFKGQQQVLEMTVDDYRTIELGYRILAFRGDVLSGMDGVVATSNFTLDVTGNRYSDVRTKIFVIKYSGGNELKMEEK